MNIHSSKFRTVTFTVLFILAVIICVITYYIANNQNQLFEEDFHEFHYAMQLSNQGGFEEAEEIFLDLIGRKPASPTLEWNTGLNYAMKGDLDTALLHYEEAMKIRPFLRKEPFFMIQFGELLLRNDQLEQAQVYLEETLTLDLPEDYRLVTMSLLEEIESDNNNANEDES